MTPKEKRKILATCRFSGEMRCAAMPLGLHNQQSPERDECFSYHLFFFFTVALMGMNGEQAIFAAKWGVSVCVRREVGRERVLNL